MVVKHFVFSTKKEAESVKKTLKRNRRGEKIEKNGKFEYLTNITNDKFIMCKKIEYPIIKTYSGEISK